MVSDARQRLTDDHRSLDQLLNQLKGAISGENVTATHAYLDLFWALLAVHIRAEHLHLFPKILLKARDEESGADLCLHEAQLIIDGLREDHDFFMRELAAAMGIARELLRSNESLQVQAGIKGIGKIVEGVQVRLRRHNEIEEETIYRWGATLFSADEQAMLAEQIDGELRKRPPRFERMY